LTVTIRLEKLKGPFLLPEKSEPNESVQYLTLLGNSRVFHMW